MFPTASCDDHVISPDYVSIGPRFSNQVLQALLVLLRKLPPTVSSKSWFPLFLGILLYIQTT